MSKVNVGTITMRGVPVIAAKHRGKLYLARPLLFAVLGRNQSISVERAIPDAEVITASNIPAVKNIIRGLVVMIEYNAAIKAILQRKDLSLERIEQILNEKAARTMLKIAIAMPKMDIDIPESINKLSKVDINKFTSTTKNTQIAHSDESTSLSSDKTLDYGDDVLDLNSPIDNDYVVSHVDIRGLKVLCVKYKSQYYLAKPQLLALLGLARVRCDEFNNEDKTVSAGVFFEAGIMSNSNIRSTTKFVEFDYAMCELKRYGKVDAKLIEEVIRENDYLNPLIYYAKSSPASSQHVPTYISSQNSINSKKRKIIVESAEESSVEEPPKKKSKLQWSTPAPVVSAISQRLIEMTNQVEKLKILLQKEQELEILEQKRREVEAMKRELGF